MKINTKIRYGLRAMIEIAKHTSENGVLQKDIAVNQSISLKYLDPILNSLKVANLIKKKSHKEGYILVKPAKEITIFEIHNAFEPGIKILDCLDINNDCSIDTKCDVKGFWCELNTLISDKFKSVTLSELVHIN
jgi:Rrf2 family protein